jgi:hypothetical protein
VKAVVTYLLDDVVTEDEHVGERITVKIHRDGCGYVTCDGDMTLYRRTERIALLRSYPSVRVPAPGKPED